MHKLAQLCVNRPVFATMLVMSLVVVGVFCYFSLGVDLFPKVDIPTVAVIIANPGASPEEIETEISRKVEDAVNTISQIDEVRSVSSEGQSLVTITFELSKNGDVAAQEVQNKVNIIVPQLPQTAKQPIVQKFDPDAAPIMQIAVSAPRSLRDVTLIADKQIKQKLENAKGVGQITIVGGATREIHVQVDPDRLRAYKLTVTDVFNALRAQNLELPGGNLNEGARELTVRTTGRVIDAAQFNQITVANRNGYIVKVADIGYAEDSYAEPRSSARLDGQPSVTLVVAKQSGVNTVDTADEVRQRLKEISVILPKDVKAQIVADQSVFIKAAVENIKKHLIEGSFFAAIIIFLFLANIRTTLIAAVAIPTSIISTFALMAAMGFTLNQITMLALTLMVGIVIDDAIIVLENIFRFIEEKNMPPFQAAIQGTKEIGLAVMATTLSLLAVFLPVGFMGGIVGRFMSSFGFTSAFAIAVSLLVSFTLTPMLSSRFIKRPEPVGPGQHASKESFIFKFLDKYYTRMLVWSMAHRKTIVAACVLVVLSIVPLFMFVGKNFLPKDDQAQYNVLIRTPEGTSLAATAQLGEQIATEIRKLPGVQHTLLSVGNSADKSVNNASIFVKLTDIEQRDVSQNDLMERTRSLMKKYPPEIHTGVELVSSVGGNQSNADIQYFIQGPDLQKLAEYADKLSAKMRAMPGLVDVDSSLRSGKPEVRLEIDRPRAADLGVSVLDIEQALNTLIAGQTASTFNAGDDQYDVVVRAQEQFRGQDGLSKLTVPSSRVGSVGLDEVVHIKPGSGPSSINRIARQRQVTLTGNVLAGGSQAAVLAQLNEATASMRMDPDYRSGLTGASKELGRTGFYFALAFGLTFVFMYIVLAAQFESFIHPITILLTLPLAIPFGILSLLIAGQTVNIFSGLGLLLLFGIVKKNAILQIDHTNGLREAGMRRYDAIIQANRDRLRPILMTTIALVAGMMPLVISRGVGSATNRSIGVLVVGGQTLCLLLTLLAVPVFYSLWEDFGDLLARVRNRLTKTAAISTALIGSLFGQPAIPPVKKVPVTTRPGILTQAPLRLNEVIERVLANDPDLNVARVNLEQAGYSITSAQGAYDPVVGVRAYRTRAVTATASLIGGSASGKLSNTEWTATPTLSGNTLWGGTYNVNFANSRLQNDSSFNTLNPQYPTSLAVNLVQPLWRGLRYDDNRHRLEVARRSRQLSITQFRQRITDVVTQAIQAYWELDYAYNNVAVQTQGVQLAEQQYESNKRQAEQGILAPVDVVAAQTQFSTFQQNLLLAQQVLTQAENNLKMLMLPDRTDLMWSAALIPESPLNSNAPIPTLVEAVQQALQARPEIDASSLAIDLNKADQRLAYEAAKPRVDAFANMTGAGLAGTVIPSTGSILGSFFPGGLAPVAPILNGSYGQSLSNILHGNFPTAQVGVTVSLPLRNRTALSQAAIASAEGRKLQITQNQVAMAVEADVRNAMQAVEAGRARLEAAGLARQSAEEQYASEQRQFQAGTSSVFLVLQRQTDLITARNREARSRADLGESLAALDRATAHTIEAHNISVK